MAFAGPRRALLHQTPSWILPSAIMDIYMSQGLAWANGRQTVPSQLLTCARATTGYAQWGNGTWSLFANNTLRNTDQGLLVEEASTNLALWGRDFTQSGTWIATNATAALDQIGIDGNANSASSITATSSSSTVLQTPGLSSSARTFSIFIKRITGTGTVKITIDGSAYSADLSGNLSTTSWYRASVTATVAPIIGIQLGTSGDKIAVDFAQLEATGFTVTTIPTSPILTTSGSATRNSDNISFSGGSPVKSAPFTMFAQVANNNVSLNRTLITVLTDGTTANRSTIAISNSNAAALTTIISGSTSASITGTAVPNGILKEIGAFAPNDFALVVNGGTVSTSSSGSLSTGTQAQLGSRSDFGAGTQIEDYIQRIAFWQSRLPNSTLQALTR